MTDEQFIKANKLRSEIAYLQAAYNQLKFEPIENVVLKFKSVSELNFNLNDSVILSKLNSLLTLELQLRLDQLKTEFKNL